MMKMARISLSLICISHLVCSSYVNHAFLAAIYSLVMLMVSLWTRDVCLVPAYAIVCFIWWLSD